MRPCQADGIEGKCTEQDQSPADASPLADGSFLEVRDTRHFNPSNLGRVHHQFIIDISCGAVLRISDTVVGKNANTAFEHLKRPLCTSHRREQTRYCYPRDTEDTMANQAITFTNPFAARPQQSNQRLHSSAALSRPYNSNASPNNTYLLTSSPIKAGRRSPAPQASRPTIMRTKGQRPACLVNASVTYCGNNSIYAFGGFDQYTDEGLL